MINLNETKLNIRRNVISATVKSMNEILNRYDSKIVDTWIKEVGLPEDEIEVNILYQTIFQLANKLLHSVPKETIMAFVQIENEHNRNLKQGDKDKNGF